MVDTGDINSLDLVIEALNKPQIQVVSFEKPALAEVPMILAPQGSKAPVFTNPIANAVTEHEVTGLQSDPDQSYVDLDDRITRIRLVDHVAYKHDESLESSSQPGTQPNAKVQPARKKIQSPSAVKLDKNGMYDLRIQSMIGANQVDSSAGSAYWDQSNAHKLKRLSQAQPGTKEHEQSIKQASRQFEAIMLNTLMKQARSGQGLVEEDQSMKSYRSMHDEQITHSMATSGRGVGFAQTIEKSLRRQSKAISPQEAMKRISAENSKSSVHIDIEDREAK